MGEYSEVLQSQRSFFKSGATLAHEFRFGALSILKASIIENQEKMCMAAKEDFGKPEFETYETEILPILMEIDYFLRNLKKLMKPRRAKTRISAFMQKGYVYSEAYGSVLIISPWNYPFYTAISPLVGAIAGGNTVVLLSSEKTSACTKLMGQMFSELFEEKYIKAGSSGESINTDVLKERFDKIFFTGSTRVGRIVMRAAAENLTPVTLELGGKSPAIIDKTADLKLAAKKIVWGKFVNAGQTCVAPDYVLVPRHLKAALVAEMGRVIREFYGDNPLENADLARIIDKRSFDRLSGLMAESEVIFGGGTDKSTLKIEPTLISAKEGDKIMEEEIFGPLLPIIEKENLGEMLEYLDEKEKPLATYFFSKDKKAQKYVLEYLSYGGAFVNGTLMHTVSGLPFGGVGNSGMGKYIGKASFSCFTHEKSALVSNSAFDLKLVYPPYSEKNLSLLKKVIKFYGR